HRRTDGDRLRLRVRPDRYVHGLQRRRALGDRPALGRRASVTGDGLAIARLAGTRRQCRRRCVWGDRSAVRSEHPTAVARAAWTVPDPVNPVDGHLRNPWRGPHRHGTPGHPDTPSATWRTLWPGAT